MTFHYVAPENVLADSVLLAKKVLQSGFAPTVTLSLWRGGTGIGYAVNSYFNKSGCRVIGLAVSAASYSGVSCHGKLTVNGLEQLLDIISPSDHLLIIDDIYDSGNTVNELIRLIKDGARRNAPHQIAVACIDKRVGSPTPDYPIYYIHDVSPDVWQSNPHEFSDLVGAFDRGQPALLCKSEPLYDILTGTAIYPTAHSDSQTIRAGELLADAAKLANNIYRDGFFPDRILAVWPDGVNAGLPVTEFFKYKALTSDTGRTFVHGTVGVTYEANGEPHIHIPRYIIDGIGYEEKILIVNTIQDASDILHKVTATLKNKVRNNIDLNKVRTAAVYKVQGSPDIDCYLCGTDKPITQPQDDVI